MKKILILSIFIIGVAILSGIAQNIAYLDKTKNKTQLIVDNKPFIMLSGELHNSSSSTTEYSAALWPKLKKMNLNSVIASISWELLEPKEGQYDYKLVDSLIKNADENNMKLCFIWFASWKNGESSYVPLWVKKDTKRFFRVKDKNGRNIETISPFCEEAMRADAKAFGLLLKHIKEVDINRAVIMIQPENEVGIFQDIDYNEIALKTFDKEVPIQLFLYLKKNIKILNEELKSLWQINGFKTKGTWKEVFGNNMYTKEFIMAWQYASYINEVARTGKKEYKLPMYVNAWIVQDPKDSPGVYPNGGPVSKVMDIYKAAAKDIDVLSPDIYLPNFKEIVAMYHRQDNPLLIPESTLDAGRAFYALAEHDAICFSPFGIEDGANDFVFAQSYKVLNELMPLITEFQGTGKMIGILKEGEESERSVQLGNYQLKIVYEKKNEPCYGLVIQTSDNEFLVAGMNLKITFDSTEKNKIGCIGQVWEGRFENGIWIPSRLLNGDETRNNRVLKVIGRQFATTQKQIDTSKTEKTEEQFVYTANKFEKLTTPGIYKVITYQLDR